MLSSHVSVGALQDTSPSPNAKALKVLGTCGAPHRVFPKNRRWCPGVPNSGPHNRRVRPAERHCVMNKDQVEGTAKNMAGKVQQTVGKLAGNPAQQAKGLKKQTEGTLQSRVGDAKEALKGAHDSPVTPKADKR